MNDNLTIQDPLANKPVTILIMLEPDSLSRAGRTATITVGVKGEPPVFGRGAFEDIAALIRLGWHLACADKRWPQQPIQIHRKR